MMDVKSAIHAVMGCHQTKQDVKPAASTQQSACAFSIRQGTAAKQVREAAQHRDKPDEI